MNVTQPPHTPSTSDSNSPQGGTHRWTVAEKALSAVAGVLAVISAVLGLVTVQTSSAKEDAQQAEQAKSEDLSSLQAKYDELETQNRQLQADNESLRARQNPPAGPTGSPLPTQDITSRHSGLLTLAYRGNVADLDAPGTNRQWEGEGNDGDVRYDREGGTGDQVLQFYSPVIQIAGGQADYDVCSTTTGHVAASIKIDEITNGDTFCVKTDEFRHSAVKVTAINNETISLDVVTFDPPYK